jgi:hypothetical protein
VGRKTQFAYHLQDDLYIGHLLNTLKKVAKTETEKTLAIEVQNKIYICFPPGASWI